MTYSLDLPYLEMPLAHEAGQEKVHSQVYGKPWSLPPSNAVSRCPWMMQCLNYSEHLMPKLYPHL